MYCGAHARRLGPCDVCSRSVCEQCGNVQHMQGERRIVHDACLKKTGGGFSMIRLVDD